MTNPGTLKITAHGDRELVMTRAFDAPRHLVFDAMTKPELVKRWLGVFGGWSLVVCEIDLKVGGAYRYLWRNTNGKEMAMGGVYREIVRPERVVATEKFDDPWYPGDALGTAVLVEQRGRTTLTTTMRYDSKATRDAILKSPMETGVAASYDTLEKILVTTQAQEAK